MVINASTNWNNSKRPKLDTTLFHMLKVKVAMVLTKRAGPNKAVGLVRADKASTTPRS